MDGVDRLARPALQDAGAIDDGIDAGQVRRPVLRVSGVIEVDAGRGSNRSVSFGRRTAGTTSCPAWINAASR
jgi:hypothetical protein